MVVYFINGHACISLMSGSRACAVTVQSSAKFDYGYLYLLTLFFFLFSGQRRCSFIQPGHNQMVPRRCWLLRDISSALYDPRAIWWGAPFLRLTGAYDWNILAYCTLWCILFDFSSTHIPYYLFDFIDIRIASGSGAIDNRESWS